MVLFALSGVDRGQRQRLRPWEDLSGALPLILGTSGHAAGQRDGRQLRHALRPPVAAAGLLGVLEALQRLRRGPGLLLIRERSSAGSCARPGSRAPAAPSASRNVFAASVLFPFIFGVFMTIEYPWSKDKFIHSKRD